MNTLTPNSLAFIALANEFCQAIENASGSTPASFTTTMTRLLPRLYMSATDLQPAVTMPGEDCGFFIDSTLSEDYYESVRLAIENLLGADDTYLETFEEDMKYSDTPISASISESLADIFQVLYNFLDTVRDATDEITNEALQSVKEDFTGYWSQKVCNVMRPLNHLRFSGQLDPDE